MSEGRVNRTCDDFSVDGLKLVDSVAKSDYFRGTNESTVNERKQQLSDKNIRFCDQDVFQDVFHIQIEWIKEENQIFSSELI